MKCYVIANPVSSNIEIIKKIKADDYVIAVDGALVFCIKNNIRVNLVVGDFDSLESIDLLAEYQYIKLNRIKDQTDTYEAVKKAYEMSDNVFLIGGIGGNRLEHSIANLNLLAEFKQLVILTKHSRCYLLEKGLHKINFKGFISIFPYEIANITLKGFKYPLNGYQFKKYDSLGISNELIADEGTIIVNDGRVLVIESEYD